MSTDSIKRKTNKYYMTYGEVLKFAIESRLSTTGKCYEGQYIVECFKETIIDINDAIEDREILPIVTTEPRTKIGDIRHYLDVNSGVHRVFALIILTAVLFIIAGDINLQSLEIYLSKYDLIKLLRNTIVFGGIILYIRFNRATDLALYMKALGAHTDAPGGMIRYQLREANFRGYVKSLYSTESVLRFINGEYKFNFKSYEYKQSYERYIAAGGYDKVTSMDDHIIKALIEEVKELEELLAPPQTPSDDISAELNDLQYTPVRTAKEKIRSFIKEEIQPPCTCYHTQFCRYMIEHKDDPGFGVSLKYIDRSAKEKTISEKILRDIVKTIMKSEYPMRVQSSKVALNRCQKHNIL